MDAIEARDAVLVERLLVSHIQQARGRWAHPAAD
nr:hypothetical protein [Nocardioides convexus]